MMLNGRYFSFLRIHLVCVCECVQYVFDSFFASFQMLPIYFNFIETNEY